MYSSEHFGRIFWVDDELEFKSCPLCVDGTGDFDCEDYVSEWSDWEGVDVKLLFAIYRTELINKTQFAGSLSLNDKAHHVYAKPNYDDPRVNSDDNYADKVDTLVSNMKEGN